jgi:hypothetical protein
MVTCSCSCTIFFRNFFLFSQKIQQTVFKKRYNTHVNPLCKSWRSVDSAGKTPLILNIGIKWKRVEPLNKSLGEPQEMSGILRVPKNLFSLKRLHIFVYSCRKKKPEWKENWNLLLNFNQPVAPPSPPQSSTNIIKNYSAVHNNY